MTQQGEVPLLDSHPPVVPEQAWFRQCVWGQRAWLVFAVVRFVVVAGGGRGGTGRAVAAPLDCLLPHYTPGSLHSFRPFDDGVTVPLGLPTRFTWCARTRSRPGGQGPPTLGDDDKRCWQKPALPVAKTIAHNQRPRKIPKPCHHLNRSHTEPLTFLFSSCMSAERSWRWCRRWALDCCVRIAEGAVVPRPVGGAVRDGCQVLLRGTRPRLRLGVYVPTGQYLTKRHRVTQHAMPNHRQLRVYRPSFGYWW